MDKSPEKTQFHEYWGRAMRDAWDEATHFAGFKTRIGVIGLAIALMTIVVHWERAGDAAARDEVSIFWSGVHAALYVFGAIYVICLFRSPWKRNSDQENIVRQQAEAISRLQSGGQPRIALRFDKPTCIQVLSHGELLYRVAADLLDSGSISRMWCQLADIEAVDCRDRDTHQILQRFRGRELLCKHERPPFPDQRPMDPGKQVEFDVIGETKGCKHWHLCFTTIDEMHPVLPIGRYRLTVSAGGSRVTGCKIKLEAFPNAKGRLIVTKIEQATSPATPDHPPAAESH